MATSELMLLTLRCKAAPWLYGSRLFYSPRRLDESEMGWGATLTTYLMTGRNKHQFNIWGFLESTREAQKTQTGLNMLCCSVCVEIDCLMNPSHHRLCNFHDGWLVSFLWMG